MIGTIITICEVYGAALVFLCTLIAIDEIARRLRERRRQRPFDWDETLSDIRQLPERERWLA